MVKKMNTCNPLYSDVIRHLGGEARLKDIGARVAADDGAHVSLSLVHPNPRGVRSVVIRMRGNGLYDMECFGPMRLDGFVARPLGKAEQIVPDSLASVLGKMTGVESLHHHHY